MRQRLQLIPDLVVRANIALLVLRLSQAQAEAALGTWNFSTSFSTAATVAVPASVGSGILVGTVTGGGGGQIEWKSSGGVSDTAYSFYKTVNPQTSGANFVLQVLSPGNSTFTINYYKRTADVRGWNRDVWSYSVNDGSSWVNFTSQPADLPAKDQWTQRTVSQTIDIPSGERVWFRNGMELLNTSYRDKEVMFDSISINTTPVPEPVALALCGFGVLGATASLARRWVKRHPHGWV